MSPRPEQILIYHITDVENLAAILAAGGLHSDAVMAQKQHAVIGYNHGAAAEENSCAVLWI